MYEEKEGERERKRGGEKQGGGKGGSERERECGDCKLIFPDF